MPPLQQSEPTPAPSYPAETAPHPKKAANDDFFEVDKCDENLNEDDRIALFKKRKATEWMVNNRTDGNSPEIYAKELARIKDEMARIGISDEDYRLYLAEVEGIVD